MIRKVRPEDAKSITDIYNRYVQESIVTFETEPLAVEVMLERINDISRDFPYYVYEIEGNVAGYCYVHPWKERAAYKYTLETTVYLTSECKGKGIGRQLMDVLINDCRKSGYRALIACITSKNEESCRLHERLGFKKVSHFEKVGMKFGEWLDVSDYELLFEE